MTEQLMIRSLLLENSTNSMKKPQSKNDNFIAQKPAPKRPSHSLVLHPAHVSEDLRGFALGNLRNTTLSNGLDWKAFFALRSQTNRKCCVLSENPDV